MVVLLVSERRGAHSGLIQCGEVRVVNQVLAMCA